MKWYLIFAVIVVLAGCGGGGPWPGGLTDAESPYAGRDGLDPAIGVTFEDLVGPYVRIDSSGGPDTCLVLQEDGRFAFAIRERSDTEAEGTWSVKIDKSSWLALLIRGNYPGMPEVIAAHSSPVMVQVEGSHFMAAADAVTILEQIEGAIAYIDIVGTRADTEAYKRMRLVLTAAHRSLHNRLHQAGHFHEHTPIQDHTEHHA